MLIQDYPLERNGISLRLDCARQGDPVRNILLVHGATNSSHEFDINYEDYSLVRRLVREGYAVWRIDIAGYGHSGEVPDGFLPDSDYAAEDICAAVQLILRETGQEKVDLLGWSWGTVTTTRFTTKHPELVNRLVLYAPIISGLGETDVSEPFHHNTWETAVDDFQRNADGSFDETVTDPIVIELWCSSCWHHDGEQSPSAAWREICVDSSKVLIDFKKIPVPTLIICGDSDPYLNYSLVYSALNDLPESSRLEVIKGASHAAFVEKPFHRDFQDRVLRFLMQ